MKNDQIIIKKLSDEFSKIIRSELSDFMHEIILKNEKNDPEVCATHDYCDANQLMEAAFNNLEINLFNSKGMMTEKTMALWSAAWDKAKSNNFEVKK